MTVSGDFNADGKSDILWQLNGNLIYEWWMNGPAVINNVPVVGIVKGFPIVAIGDFNGDNMSDMIVQMPDTSLTVRQWQMDPLDGTHIKIDYQNFGGNGWMIVGIGDFNADARSDILWQSPTGSQVYEWQMNGGPSDVIKSIGIGGGNGWTVAGVGDFNGDGKADILWQQPNGGQVFEWQMDGNQVTSSVAIGGGNGWKVAGIGDFNGDGKADILWQEPNGGQVYEWQMDGNQVINSVAIGGNGWTVGGIGDFDGDHKADILWHEPNSQRVFEWLMNGNQVASSVAIADGNGWTLVVPTTNAGGDGSPAVINVGNSPGGGCDHPWLLS